MSGQRKFGEIHAKAMVQLGLVELRNATSFEGSNIQDDIRRSMYDARQNVTEQERQPDISPQQEQEQDQSLEQQQER